MKKSLITFMAIFIIIAILIGIIMYQKKKKDAKLTVEKLSKSKPNVVEANQESISSAAKMLNNLGIKLPGA